MIKDYIREGNGYILAFARSPELEFAKERKYKAQNKTGE